MIIFGYNISQKPEYTPDDTFIYLQYAKNIASGNGFSFNSGEQSYGVTSPLWVLLMTIPYFTGINGFWFAKILDLLAALLAMVVFFRLTKFFFPENTLLRHTATGIFIINAWFVRWAFTGMETSLAVLLVLYIFYLYYSQKYSLMFFICGLMYLTRPESIVLIIILFALVMYHQIKIKKFSILKLLKYTGLVLITVLPFLIFAKLNFGTFLPNTALGKSTLTLNITVIINQLKEITKTLAGSSIPEMMLSLWFLIIAIRKKDFYAKHPSDNTIPLVLWILGLSILYVVTDADIISRYLLIISPFIILIGLKAIELIKYKQIVVTIAVYLICVFYSQFIFYKFVKPSTNDFTIGVNECLIPIGKWLHDNTPGDSKILVNDVGVIGYFSERYIIDAAALINRDIELNKQIMNTQLDDRQITHRLLKFIKADYVIDRDSSEHFAPVKFDNYKLKPEFMRKFPSLGISDNTPRYFKVYKVIKIN